MTARNNAKKIKQIEDNLVTINYQSFSDSATIDDVLAKNRNLIATLKQELSVISTEINSRLQLLGSIERLVREVKDKGKEILLLNQTIEDCPLCNTHLGYVELSNNIDRIITSGGNTSIDTNSDDLIKRRVSKETDLNTLEIKNQYIQIIKNNYEEIFNKPSGHVQVSECIHEIGQFYFNKPEIEKSLYDLEGIKDYGTSHSIDEDRLREIKVRFNALMSGKFDLIVGEKENIENELKILQDFKVREEQDIIQLINKRTESAENIKSKLELPLDQTLKTKEVSLEIETDLSELKSLLESYIELESIVEYQEDEMIEDFYSRIEMFEKSLITFKGAMTANQELSQAKKDKEDGEKYLKQNEIYLKRMENGIAVLDELNLNGGSSEIELFFISNFRQILEIFKTIHAPREFTDLQYKDGQVILIDQFGESRKVSEISTGQRAALALSIFIAMNRILKKGPNLIMFDDPISHVDDLNALSFLDFLRIFILKEKKQIFFSSANSRLATLFQKKFEFLGSDFKQWELKRQNSIA